MLVRRVVGHKIENQLEAPLMDGLQQLIEVSQIAKVGIHIAVVSNVVAEIGHGRGVEGRDPYRFDPQLRKVIEPLQDSLKIANAVAICILEGPRINLIKNAVLPPHCCG
jgi:hypothetical protein